MSVIARAGIRTVIGDVVLGVVLFVATGDLAGWPAWAYMVVLVVSGANRESA